MRSAAARRQQRCRERKEMPGTSPGERSTDTAADATPREAGADGGISNDKLVDAHRSTRGKRVLAAERAEIRGDGVAFVVRQYGPAHRDRDRGTLIRAVLQRRDGVLEVRHLCAQIADGARSEWTHRKIAGGIRSDELRRSGLRRQARRRGDAGQRVGVRSEERRVGKECGCWWAADR